MRIVFLIAGIAAAVAITALLWRMGGDIESREADKSGVSTSSEPVVIDSDADRQGRRIAQDADSHQIPRSAMLTGSVHDFQGVGLAGAEITWTALEGLPLSAERSWAGTDFEALEAATIATTSGKDGSFAFEATPPAVETGASVLWISALGHAARPLLLDPEKASSYEHHVIQLNHAPGIRILVVDGDGAVISNAIVEQTGIEPPLSKTASDAMRRAWRAFHRTWVTSSGEPIIASALPGKVAISARRAGLEAKPWIGTEASDETVTLVLVPTFQVLGRIVIEQGSWNGTSLQVNVYAGAAEALAAVNQTRVRSDLAWGPIAVPVLDVPEFVLQVVGGELLPVMVPFRPQPAGAAVSVNIVTRQGLPTRVSVQDEEGKPIPGARVALSIRRDEGFVSPSAYSNEEGFSVLDATCSGSAYLFADARGFAHFIEGPFSLEVPGDDLAARMKRTGVLRGRVTHEGAPVEAFTVVYWQDNPHTFDKKEIGNSKDGSFLLDTVPLGEVAVLAYSEELPRSMAQYVEIESGEEGLVEIELAVPVSGRGRVVDAATGEVPAGAQVQPWNSHGTFMLTRMGPPFPVDPSGRFEISRLPLGDSILTVTAPGYANCVLHGLGKPGATVDFGTISLARTQNLEVRLVGAPEGTDFSSCRAHLLNGPDMHPVVPFDANGVAVVSGVSPTEWSLSVTGPDDELHHLQLLLRAGEPWVVQVPIGGSRTLHVSIQDPPADLEEGDLVARVDSKLSSGTVDMCYRNLDREGRATFTHLAATPVGVTIESPEQGEIGYAAADLREGDQEVRVAVGERVTIRLRTADGIPLAKAIVRAYAVSLPGWDGYFVTREDGSCLVPILPVDDPLFYVFHESVGWSTNPDVRRPPGEPDVIEVVIDPRAKLEIHLLDGNEPLTGVLMHCTAQHGEIVMAAFSTDERGIGSKSPVDEGKYRVKIHAPGLWPTERVVEATEKEGPAEVQVRRLGAFEWRVLSSEGLPVTGVRLSATSKEFGEVVGDWISDGRASGQLTTDAQGRIHLQGVPNGAYDWEIANDVEVLAAGTSQVPPQAKGSQVVVLP